MPISSPPTLYELPDLLTLHTALERRQTLALDLAKQALTAQNDVTKHPGSFVAIIDEPHDLNVAFAVLQRDVFGQIDRRRKKVSHNVAPWCVSANARGFADQFDWKQVGLTSDQAVHFRRSGRGQLSEACVPVTPFQGSPAVR